MPTVQDIEWSRDFQVFRHFQKQQHTNDSSRHVLTAAVPVDVTKPYSQQAQSNA
jgi:hypothetical protein